jgi:hypothetical protein
MEQEKNGSDDVQLNDEFVCDLCGESFDSVSDLEEHKRDTHQRPSFRSATENWNVQGDIGAAGLPGAPQV